MTTVGEFHPHHPYSKEGYAGKPPRKLSMMEPPKPRDICLKLSLGIRPRLGCSDGLYNGVWRRIVCTTTSSSSVWIGPYFCLSKRGPLWGLPSLRERQVSEERAHQNLVLAHTLPPPAKSGEFPTTHRKPQLGSSKWFENGPVWNHPNQSHWNCPEKQT